MRVHFGVPVSRGRRLTIVLSHNTGVAEHDVYIFACNMIGHHYAHVQIYKKKPAKI